ncbi:MAG TPA: FtsQ-type POTRA domain-containing protein [Streptosporangiaceae bacterium]|jgi:cell division protein FtsQ
MTGPSDTAQDRPARPGGADPGGAGERRPERLPPRRRAAPWRAAFLVVLALVIVAGAAWALLGSSLLVVRHVQVSGNRGVPAAEISAAAGIDPGTPLARLNSATAERRVERIPQILSALVSRSWPDTVRIAVRERTARLAVAAGTGYELVDPHGVVVRRSAARPAGMPLLNSPPAQLRNSPAVAAAAAVLASLPATVRARVLAVTDTAAGVTLRLRGRVTVRWGDARRSAAKATELQALLRTGARSVDVSSRQVAVTGR